MRKIRIEGEENGGRSAVVTEGEEAVLCPHQYSVLTGALL